MVSKLDLAAGTYTVTFTPEELDLINWTLAYNGPQILDEMFTNFITGRAAQRGASVMEALYADYKTKTPEEQASILTSVMQPKPSIL